MDFFDEWQKQKRRTRKSRDYSSSSSHHRKSSRRNSEDYRRFEQEIVDRAIQIERDRESILRRQFWFIVNNVQKMERQRLIDHYRRKSRSIYTRSRRSSSEKRSSSTEYQRRRISSRSTCSSCDQDEDESYCQITMIYKSDENCRHGDDLLILYKKKILFRGFVQNKEKFSFRIFSRQINQRGKIEFEVYLNDIFQSKIQLDLENRRIYRHQQLFEVEQIQMFNSSKEKFESNDRQNKEKSKSKKENNREKSKFNSKRKENQLEQKMKSKRKEENLSSSSTRTNLRENNQTNNDEFVEFDMNFCSIRSGKSSKSRNDRSSSSDHSNEQINKDQSDKLKLKKDVEESKEEQNDSSSIVFSRVAIESKRDETKGNEEEDQNKSEDEENDRTTAVNGFLQLLQAMTTDSIQFSSSADEQSSLENLFSQLGMSIESNRKVKRSNFTPRKVGNIENGIVICLTDSPFDSSIINKIRSSVNLVESFSDSDDCLALINTILNQQIYLIVDDKLGDSIVRRVLDLEQIFKIYVFCQDDEEKRNWSNNQEKIEVFTNIEDILTKISIDVELNEENNLSYLLTTATTNPKEESNFLISQLVKEILLDHDEMSESRQELISFVREEYSNNEQQLKLIQSFDDQYQSKEPMEFYHRNSFISKMLNRGFRTLEVDLLFKVRLFIQNLHQFIVSSNSKRSPMKFVYRSMFVDENQIDLLKKYLDLQGFICFPCFVRASTDRKGILFDSIFEMNRKQSKKKFELIFEIDVSNSDQFLVFGQEILLNFGLVYRLENFNKDKDEIFRIQLKQIQIDEEILSKLIEPIRREIRAPFPSLRLIKLFIELEEYSRSVYLGETILTNNQRTRKDSLLALARVYHSLGTTLYEKEEYDQALDVLHKSHSIYRKFLSDDAPQLSPTWNNMGSIYLRQGKIDLALEYHEKALSIQLKSPSPDLPSIISYSNNIGGVYLKLERYDQALIHFKRALQIEEQTLPKNHPELAGTYHRIAGVYFRQNNHLKALEYYEKTLEIELLSLPDNHPTVAVTYHNLGTAFEGLGRLEEALQSANKAVERLLKTLPKEHPQVRLNQSYADRLKQKLWVKQLFSS